MTRRSAAVAIAVTLGQLLAGQRTGWSPDQEMVLDAMRRSTKALAEASDDVLAAYFSSLSAEQTQGVISNVKGIFHEMLVAAAENGDGDNVTAKQFELTNHPGADLEYSVNGDTIGSVQVKAVQDPAAIIEHFTRYPDMNVLATTEVTESLQGAFSGRLYSSGFRNEDLTRITTETLHDLTGEDFREFVQDGLLTSALLGGALQAKALLAGEKLQPAQVRSYLELAGISAGTALAVDAALNLL